MYHFLCEAPDIQSGKQMGNKRRCCTCVFLIRMSREKCFDSKSQDFDINEYRRQSREKSFVHDRKKRMNE